MFQPKSKQKNNNSNAKHGFSLIEIMVSVSIFTIVVLIVVGALVSINDANRKIQSMRALMDNLNFALENMSRNIRTGSVYHCGSGDAITMLTPQDCASNGSDYLTFKGPDGNQIVFQLSNGQIQKSTNGGSTFLGMTSPDITVTKLMFYVDGAPALDVKQPKMLLLVGGTAKASKGLVSEFHLQTTISQRLIDS